MKWSQSGPFSTFLFFLHLPLNVLLFRAASPQVKATISEQEVEPSVINAQRLWNAFRPASDLESLYRQGYDLTKRYIDDDAKMAMHHNGDDNE